MPDRAATSEHLSRWLQFSLGLVVLGTTIQFFAVPVADNDLWGHVLFGREILSGHLPRENGYSFTAPHHPWINHEILAECALAWSYDRFGSAGLLGLRLLVGITTIGILAGIARRRAAGPIATAVGIVFAASLMSFGFLSRPQIFSFAFLAVVWAAIDSLSRRPGTKTLWWIPPLIVLWVNTHGGVLAGVAVFAVAAAFLIIGGKSRRAVAGAVGLSGLALLANPYGWELPAFLLRDVTIERPIGEWAPIPLFDLSNVQFKLACIAAIAGFALTGVRRRPWEAVIIAAAAVATFRHERHLPLFAVLVTPHLIVSLQLLFTRLGFDRPSLWASRILAGLAAPLAMLQIHASVDLHRKTGFGILVPREKYPVEAVGFLRERGGTGNLAVPFGWGEYALWHLHPAYRVSIDGRYTTAYPDPVIEAAWRYMEGSEGWDRLLADASVALADARHGTALRLEADPNWRLVHRDRTASVFVKGPPEAAARPTPAPDTLAPSLFP